MYKPLNQAPVKENEKQLAEQWEAMDLLKASVETRADHTPFVFYDGPPTANGRPGIHHVIARALKDAVCRYKTMTGYKVERKAGWDTHGLPVEIEVEKRLGLNDKAEIEAYGLEAFNQKCRDSVFEYEAAWREQTKRMAYLIDLDNPYITLDNDYIETEWHILDKFFKEDMIYEGHKILPYCARCGTGLASHEVAQGYKEIKTVTVYTKFKRTDVDEYFLVWTTTPWTLAANVALTVHPEVDYVRVKHNDEIYYVAEKLADEVIGGDYEVLDRLKGADMEGWSYDQFMPFVETDAKAFFVTLADYVTTEDGTGIVHTAPAFGEDDYNTGQRYGLPVLQPVDEDGKYITTPWEGQFVIDADPEIVNWLGETGRLFRKQKMDHNYPHCWRCNTPLLYYAKPSWYIEMTKIKDQLIENNNGVNWFPDHVGEKRFGNWLENLNDWALSRSRFWGTPLNIWRCDACDHLSTVGSRQELVDRAVEDIDLGVELHRPYVDDIHLTCEDCGGQMTRVPDVIDCWFDSGAMPFAQHHFPFENADRFDDLFPADFICEGIDQTRGWFYSLLAISTFMTGKAPYKNVLVNDLILDKYGKKMSKSRGNAVDSFELFDRYGADVVRWYLYHVSPAWSPTRFDEDGLGEVDSKFFGTLKNIYNFFTLYANTDGIDAATFDIPVADRPELDRWMASKLHNLIMTVRTEMGVFDTHRAVRAIQEFVVEDFSNWYIRRSRRRFWSETLDDDKRSVYLTTYEALKTVAQLAAPFAPYVTEEIFQKLTGEPSVHLSYLDDVDASIIDTRTEERMDLVRNLVTLGRAARESVKLKVRQPLASVLIDGGYRELIGDLVPLIKEELNVKDVVFVDELGEYMHFSLKPNFRVCGPILGKKMGLFSKKLNELDAALYADKFDRGETVTLDLDGQDFEVTAEHVQVTISEKEGFTVRRENNLFVILDTTLDDALLEEGYARELVSRVQQLRKQQNFEITDRIKIHLATDEAFLKGVDSHANHIKEETLADEIVILDDAGDLETYELNDHAVALTVERV